MFSTSCCNFDVSEVCIESKRPPKGNLALNWSEIMGRTGWELEAEFGLEVCSMTWPLLDVVVEVTVEERIACVTVVVVVVFSPGLVEQFGGRRMPSGFKRGGTSLAKLCFGDNEVAVIESETILGDNDAHSLDGGDGLWGDLLSGVRLAVSPKPPSILGSVGGSWRPTDVETVGRTGLLSSQVVTGFSGGRDIPYGMPELVGTLSRYSGTG